MTNQPKKRLSEMGDEIARAQDRLDRYIHAESDKSAKARIKQKIAEFRKQQEAEEQAKAK